MIWATWHGIGNIVKILLDKGAKVDVKDNSGRTALSYADEGKYSDIVRMLRTARVKK